MEEILVSILIGVIVIAGGIIYRLNKALDILEKKYSILKMINDPDVWSEIVALRKEFDNMPQDPAGETKDYSPIVKNHIHNSSYFKKK